MIATAVLTGLVAQALAQGQAQTYDLSLRPVKGQKTTYSLTFDITGQGDKMTVKAKLVNEIVDVKDDGTFIAASYQSDHQLFINDKPQKTTPGTVTGVTTYDKFGRPLKVGGDDAGTETMRIARLTSYVAPEGPVKVGDSWKDFMPADKDAGTPSVAHTYTLQSVDMKDGRQVATIEVATSETSEVHPGSTQGILTLDVKTGEQLSYEVQVGNFPVGGQYVDGKVTLVRE